MSTEREMICPAAPGQMQPHNEAWVACVREGGAAAGPPPALEETGPQHLGFGLLDRIAPPFSFYSHNW